MDIYDRMCFTVSSAGGRRGAQMGTFDVGHPDVLDFIRAKREDGRLRQFNLSLLITREFMQAVRDDAQWKLAFPLMQPEVEHEGIDLDDPESGGVAKLAGERRLRHGQSGKGRVPGLSIRAGSTDLGTSSCRRRTTSPSRDSSWSTRSTT